MPISHRWSEPTLARSGECAAEPARSVQPTRLDVNSQGDVVMVERGHRLVASLWKYSAQSRQVNKLLQVSFPGEVGGPQVSPSGKWISAIRNGQLIFIEQKGPKP